MVNEENEKKFKQFKEEHIKDGGENAIAYAITELIKDSLINKTYKLYSGGGYESNSENPIKKFDVVIWFSFGGDPFIQVCFDNSEGDSCLLINSNPQCTLMSKRF